MSVRDLLKIDQELNSQLCGMRATGIPGDPFEDLVMRRLLNATKLMDAVLKERNRKESILWMTLNFRPDVSLEDILIVLDRLSNRSFMTKYWYNIEQRGTETVHGLHSHWLVQSSHPTAQFKRDVFSTVQHVVGNKNCVDVKSYPLSFFQDKLDYLNGKKWDKDKDAKVLLDNKFRLENNLSLIYTNAPSI